jgi:hypothetical protein
MAERTYPIPHWYHIRREEHMAWDNEMISRLVKHGRSMPNRKTVYQIRPNETFPDPIDDALTVVEDRFGVNGFNTAVMKRYVPGEPSAAFTWHRDPEEYHDGFGEGEKRIVLWSVTGSAKLSVLTDGNVETVFDCKPNTGLLLPAHVTHKVTPPDPEMGKRILLFFGQSS